MNNINFRIYPYLPGIDAGVLVCLTLKLTTNKKYTKIYTSAIFKNQSQLNLYAFSSIIKFAESKGS